MRLLPPSTSPKRALAISVALPHRELDRPAGRRIANDLTQLLLNHNVSATWALDDVAALEWGRDLIDRPGFEVAILGNTHTEMGSERGGGSASFLGRRIRACLAAGTMPTTLVNPDAAAIPPLALLAKYGISVVATTQTKGGRRSRKPIHPSGTPLLTLRFNLWQLTAAAKLPVSSRLTIHSSSHRVRRLIDRALSDDRLVYLHIDGREMAAGGLNLRALERVVRHAHRRRITDGLRVLTLGEIARQLPLSRKQPPATSILRAA